VIKAENSTSCNCLTHRCFPTGYQSPRWWVLHLVIHAKSGSGTIFGSFSLFQHICTAHKLFTTRNNKPVLAWHHLSDWRFQTGNGCGESD